MRSTEFSFLSDSIQVEHEYTLVPLDKMKEEWWSEGLKDDVRIQWKVDQDRKEVCSSTYDL